jgi:hypothetical protein
MIYNLIQLYNGQIYSLLKDKINKMFHLKS